MALKFMQLVKLFSAQITLSMNVHVDIMNFFVTAFDTTNFSTDWIKAHLYVSTQILLIIKRFLQVGFISK